MKDLFTNLGKVFDEVFNSVEFEKLFDEKDNNSSYFKKEKWVDGELVSKDEVEYKNGERVKDLHVCKNLEDKCKCEKPCEKEKVVEGTSESIKVQEEKIRELENLIKQDEQIYKELKSRYDHMRESFEKLEQENKMLKLKLNKVKNIFSE